MNSFKKKNDFKWLSSLEWFYSEIWLPRELSSGRERSDQRSPIRRLYPPVGSGATKEVLSKGYPPVWSGATKGVLSEGYMLDCLFVQIRSCIKTMSVTKTFPIYKHGGKKMAATFARFTQLLRIEFPYRRRSMGPMRLYMLAWLIVRIRSCLKPSYVPTFPTKKHSGNFRAFYTASDDRISLPEA